MNTKDKIEAVKAAAEEISNRERDSPLPATDSGSQVANEIVNKVLGAK